MSCVNIELSKAQRVARNKRVAHYVFTEDSTYLDTVEALNHTQDSYELAVQPDTPKLTEEDDQRRYTAKVNTDYYFEKRVTHKFQRKYHIDQTSKQRNHYRDVNNVRMEGGTFVHQVAEDIGREYYLKKTDKNHALDQIREFATKDGENGFVLTDQQYNDLEAQVVKIIDDIFDQQERINNRNNSTGNPTILFEQIIADPIQDIAGTMDIVAIFNDRSAMIYDYKTMSVASAYHNGRTITQSGFINVSKKNSWKLQQSEYKRILLEKYGVKNVLGTRIVPIWVNYKFDDKNKIYTKDIKSLKTGEQSKFLEEVLATYEKTGIKAIDEFLTNRYKRLQKLYDRAKNDYKNREAYRSRIERIEDSIKKFIIEADIDNMIRDTSSKFKYILDNIDKVYIEDLTDAVDEGKALIDFIENVATFHTVGTNVNEEFYQEVNKYLSTKTDVINGLKETFGHIQNVHIERVLDSLEKNQGVIREADGSIKLKEEGFFTKNWGRLSEFDNPFFQEFNRLKDIALQDVRDSVDKLEEKLALVDDNVHKWRKNRGDSYKTFVSYLVNPKTDNLYAKLDKKFYEDRSKAIQEEDFKWITNYYGIKSGYSDWFKNKSEEVQKEAERLYSTHPDKERKIKEYVDKFTLSNNLSLHSDGTPVYPQAWLKAGRTHWLQIKESSFKDYQSPEYTFINNHPPLKAYYDMLVNLNDEFRSILNLDYGSLPSNFLPNIKADAIEMLTRKNLEGVSENVGEMFGRVQQDETLFGERGSDNELKVPIFYLNPFTDAEGNIRTGIKSYDFTRSMILFGKMAYTHRYMSEIEGQVLALKDIMNTQVQFYKTDSRGRKLYDFMGELATRLGHESDINGLFQSYIDYYIYGKRIDKEGVTKKILGKEFNSTKALLGMKNYLSLKALGLGFVPGTASYVAARVQAMVEAGKGVIYTADQWKKATKLQATDMKKYHALGYYFGIYSGDQTEFLSTRGKSGIRQNIDSKLTGSTGILGGDELSRIKRYVNERVLMRPYSYGDERVDRHIAVSMAQNYGVDINGNVRRLVNLPEGSKSLWEMFNYDHNTGKVDIEAYDNEGLKKIRISFRNAVRAAQQNIKGSMTDEDVNYAQMNLVMNLMMQFKTWMPGIVRERFGGLRYNKFTDAPEWGRYSSLFSAMQDIDVEIEEAGMSLYLFKMTGETLKILSKETMSFFGGKGYQPNRVQAKLSFEKWKLNNPEAAKGMTLDMYIEAKRAGIKAALREVAAMLLFSSVIMFLAGDWDEDGKPLYRDHWVLHKMYQVANRTYTEIASFVPLNPKAAVELQKTIRTPIPLAGLMQDVGRWMSNTADESFKLATGIEDPKDKTPMFYHTMALIPGGLQFRRFLDLYEQDEVAER